MKHKYLLFLLPALVCSFYASAVEYTVTVQNFQFTPANLSVHVGDVIKWQWVSGNHTTTSVSIPSGAASWDQQIRSSSPTFSYTVTAAGTYNYECVPHSPDMPASFTATALPLELRSFTGKTTGNSNWLYWETLTEKDVQSHIVERSTDGQQWAEVGRRPGAANSTVAIKYELEDARPFNQTYYRLRSVDFDGKSSTSKAILLGSRFNIANVFPNPTVDQVTVQFTALEEESVHLNVVDITGKLVWYQTIDTKPGLNTTIVPLRQLSSGSYDLILSNGRQTTVSLRVVKE